MSQTSPRTGPRTGRRTSPVARPLAVAMPAIAALLLAGAACRTGGSTANTPRCSDAIPPFSARIRVVSDSLVRSGSSLDEDRSMR